MPAGHELPAPGVPASGAVFEPEPEPVPEPPSPAVGTPLEGLGESSGYPAHAIANPTAIAPQRPLHLFIGKPPAAVHSNRHADALSAQFTSGLRPQTTW